MFSLVARRLYARPPSVWMSLSAHHGGQQCWHSTSLPNNCTTTQQFETLLVSFPEKYVAHVQLNRPKQMNAMNLSMWRELGECFEALGEDPKCRSIVISGNGKAFTAGLDLKEVGEILMGPSEGTDAARKAFFLRKFIGGLQNSITSIEHCNKPVVAAVAGPCIGAGVDLITACDIRYCTEDEATYFQVKEVDVGLAADVGTLQRLPTVMGSRSLVAELCFTGRRLPAAEALSCGLVSRGFAGPEALLAGALGTAAAAAAKSPVAVQGTKVNLLYARDRGVAEGLRHNALWNAAAMQTGDISKAVSALLLKQHEDPDFEDI
uniref:Uncharacterized protein n=1 Tax=Heterosigma akashiwo TaxID=2829 RepID=A0A6V1PVH1_HETAK